MPRNHWLAAFGTVPLSGDGFVMLQRKCASCGASSDTDDDETCPACAAQTALEVGAPDDPLEAQADRIADQALSGRAIERPTPIAARRAARSATAVASGGRPLPTTTRNVMESHFGCDFGDVRVHADARAAASASALRARAYTVGRHLVFGNGHFTPGTHQGDRLLAHELAHVLQQTGSSGLVQRDLAVEPAGVDKTERGLTEADITAAIAFNGKHLKNKTLLHQVRDVLGISAEPAVSDRDLVLAVARWQASHGVSQDGKLGQTTLMIVVAELRAEGLDADAERAKKVFAKGVVVDVDANFCGCKQDLKKESKSADHAISEYTACGADATVNNGDDVEACIKRRAGGSVTVLASTSATSGAITMNCQRTGPCKDLLCAIDNAHEQIHSVHVRELRQKHGSGAAFTSAVQDKADWVADEVASRNTDKSLSLWALSVLDRICP